jgi:NAD-dependent deacetylase
MRAEELATPEAFRRDPRLVWEFYDWRRTVLKDILPNPAHTALVKMEDRLQVQKRDFSLITQNVDGLHALAGSKNILELHGNIWRVRCTNCAIKKENKDVPISILPHCECGELLRPDIVWFGESLPETIFSAAVDSAINSEVFLIIGTSGVVPPAPSLVNEARAKGAFTVEINTEQTALSAEVALSLFGKAGDILPSLI